MTCSPSCLTFSALCPGEWPIQTALAALANGLHLSKAYVDDAKLTDHHAIIPTHKPAGSDLPRKQRDIYELVAVRFLSVFLPLEVRGETTVLIELGQHSFRALGSIIKEPGWTVLGSKTMRENETPSDNAQQLPTLSQGHHVAKRSAQLKEGKTTAPKPYDDASLLTAMKNAGQEIKDEDLAAFMKQSGLGTPATRAAIIEKLLTVGYIERKKKSLLPTEKGKALINQVHHALKDVALTASWEQQLEDIQDGTQPADSFPAPSLRLFRTFSTNLATHHPRRWQPLSIPTHTVLARSAKLE